MGIGKKKISFDITERNSLLISNYHRLRTLNNTQSGKSNTEIINDCLSILLDLDTQMRIEFADFAANQIKKCFETGMNSLQDVERYTRWCNLKNFLTSDIGFPLEVTGSFKHYEFSQGIISVPRAWIFLNPEDAKREDFTHVFGLQFNTKKTFPSFFGVSKKEGDKFDDAEYNWAVELAEIQCEAVTKLKGLFVEAEWDGERCITSDEVLAAAPNPGIWSIPKVGEKGLRVEEACWYPKNE